MARDRAVARPLERIAGGYGPIRSRRLRRGSSAVGPGSHVPDGVPIETLRIGDEVIAHNETLGTDEIRAVTAVHVNADPVTGSVVIDGEAIATTPDHPFCTLERGWVDAGDLRSGEQVPSEDGPLGVVESVTFAGGPAVMYDLTVAVAHTYYVGAGEWLVHKLRWATGSEVVAGRSTQPDNPAPDRRTSGAARSTSFRLLLFWKRSAMP